MSDQLDILLKYLEVERIDKYLFIGNSPSRPRRVFGGQVLAQALNAAIRTVEEERSPHSMHGYFLRPGNPAKQIVYEVDPIRDGRSFTTRRVVAIQNGEAIFSMDASFQIDEAGFDHAHPMPNVPMPDELDDDVGQVLILRDIEGLAYQEIASILGIPVGSVKSRIHRARKTLRERLVKVIERD